MPKCINDETKTYKGDEPSPKGLGYSAGKLKDGDTHMGKDGNMWFVKKTTTSNRWMKQKGDISKDDISKDDISEKKVDISKDDTFTVTKLKKEKDKILMCIESNDKKTWEEFDFTKLPEDFYTYAYIPICEKIVGKETGLEEKFGGSVPFLTKENRMPKDYILLCQFKDPRDKDSDIMYQVFIDEKLDDMDNYEIRQIKLDQDTIKKQIKYNGAESEYAPYKIIDWEKKKEVISLSKLKEKLNFSDTIESALRNIYYDDEKNELMPSMGIKVGGTPMATQSGDYQDLDLIQLTYEPFLNFEWGDSGIAHVSKDGRLEWDCC